MMEVKQETSAEEQDQNQEDQDQNQEDQNQEDQNQEDQDPAEGACPDIKEEPEDLAVSGWSFSPVPVKTESDEEKPDPSTLPEPDPEPGPESGPDSLKQESDPPSESELRPLSCSFCGKRFGSGGTLTRHVWVHSGDPVLVCLVCRSSFNRESELLSHRCVRSPSPPRLSFSCPLCPRRFAKQEELRLHGADHAPCSVCSAVFADREALILHMRCHGAQTPFRCSVCGKSFAWRRLLSRHMEQHRDAKLHRYSICRRTLCRRRTLLGYRYCMHRPAPHNHNHIQEARLSASQHQEAGLPDPAPEPAITDPEKDRPIAELPPQSDDSADSDFWTEVRKRRSEPVQSAAPPDTKPETKARPPAEIEVHADGSSGAAAPVQKRFECPLCGKRFRYGYLLRRHQRSHSGEKPFRCSECSKTFSHKENLVYHMGLHTGHKRFSCPACRRRFNWLSGVKRHVCVPDDHPLAPGPGPEPRLEPGLDPGPEPGLEPGLEPGPEPGLEPGRGGT